MKHLLRFYGLDPDRDVTMLNAGDMPARWAAIQSGRADAAVFTVGDVVQAKDLGLNQTLPHDPTTLCPLNLATTWTYDNGSLAAKPLTLKLDDVSFNGWLQRTASPKPMWDFELHGDRIDLGRYVNVDSKNKKPFELPVEALRAINANGSLIFDQVVLADTRMVDVRLKLQSPEGKP